MEIIGWILAFILAITIHEAAHAWMSNRLGDPTAKIMGRLSINPLAHYDPVGTTILIVSILLRIFGVPVIPFGWAKPVMIDPYNLKNPRKDSGLISISGPLSNLIFAIIVSLFLKIFVIGLNILPFSFVYIFAPIIILNITLAVFNLLPISPLDGEKIFVALLPEKEAHEADQFLNRYGILILFFLIFPTLGGNSPISLFLSPIIDFFLKFLLPGAFSV